jgi:type II secretory pathway pseudopilin PulG
MNNEKGFSLIELMMSQGLLILAIVAALGLSTLVSTFSVNSNRITSASELTENVRLTLLGRDQCRLNLQGMKFNPSNASGAPVKQLSQFNAAGSAVGSLLETGQAIDGLQVTSILLKPIAHSGFIKVASELEFTFANNGATPIAPRKIGLVVQIKRGVVNDCWIQEDIQTAAANQNCKALTDGALDQYDSTANRCQLTNGEWFGSNNFVARCPAGTRLPTDASTNYNCEAKLPPTFVDTFPATPMELDNGKTVDIRKRPIRVQLDTATKRCMCAYGDDIAAAILSQASCRIYCQVL